MSSELQTMAKGAGVGAFGGALVLDSLFHTHSTLEAVFGSAVGVAGLILFLFPNSKLPPGTHY